MRNFSPVPVNRVVGIQRAKNRFGRPGVEKEITDYILAGQDDNDDDDDFIEEDSESEDGGPGPAHVVAGNNWASTGADEDGPEDDTCSDTSDEASPSTDIPHFARARINLTALSQVFNLYFVAARGKIHVHVPQTAPQVLREMPALVLQPRPCEMAKMSSGHLSISRASPHQINHIVVGELGDLEVLVAAYDDGDVVAYYTHAIAAVVDHNGRRSKGWSAISKPPREFFHTSVGLSAWGIACHKQSRLIAVSCNTREITVFAFALNPCKPDGTVVTAQAPRVGEDRSPKLRCGLTARQLETHLRSRTRDWRIILSFPDTAHNLPSISFCDDEHGNAERVVAVDVVGNIWVSDIWRLAAKVVRVPPSHREIERPNGWGVVVIPDKMFMPVRTAEELFGTAPNNCGTFEAQDGRFIVDITHSTFYVPDHPNRRPHELSTGPLGLLHTMHPSPIQIPTAFPTTESCGEGNDNDPYDDHEENSWANDNAEAAKCEEQHPEKEEMCRWAELAKIQAKIHPRTHAMDRPLNVTETDTPSTHFTMAIVPATGMVCELDGVPVQEFWLQVLFERNRHQHVQSHPLARANHTDQIPLRLARRFSILKTCATDVELCTPDAGGASVICHRLLENPPGLWPLEDQRYADRIAMVHCIPELSTVVVGSSGGRVALLRLTKVEGGYPFRTSFRIDQILPRSQEEKAGKRPSVLLVGMSVSPLPQPGSRGVSLFPPSPHRQDSTSKLGFSPSIKPCCENSSRRTLGPCCCSPAQRWRLLLHYIDHTVLSYTIGGQDPKETNQAS